MTKDKRILIKNIYYMLSYAFQVLKQSNYDELSSEEFENIQDLFAAILAKGIAQQLKQGLYREYITECDNLSVMRGKLDIRGTIHNILQRKQKLFCEYDELSENNLFNQILKTTAIILLRQSTVSTERRTVLKKVLLFFDSVDTIELSHIKWSMLRYQRSNQNYKMLLNICYFVLEGLLLTTDKGKFKMATFLDEQHMSRLYEKFVLEYYRYHHPNLRAAASQVAWNLEEGVIDFLPIMKTDITLRYDDKILIIDTKYYVRTMQVQSQYDSRTLYSNNLYQIFTYVKNMDMENTGNVAGMLLYAKTEETITPDCDFKMSGNKISVKTLDLNIDFKNIAAQLNRIAESLLATSTSA
ncbi:5-methylcytosine-specific restriction endonuclease system specificity protein McrC [Brevibacillus sp. DP1.3A]|uniref:5-methylcytosine-specific restriction endonuclease system specificity protein McrC n=1 Tax=Brevibacillus sp. DP1.3A TaxID=2738867 RepID=UPI00156BBC5C|nr:5-methylcytosine-specific restriction endonuclease system specificity protein McrC [Brevibacillus sp. DP1.3A]UED72211.1 5-methylcytosine-specific restriction endonuclease system specificity protein McrC [Brevibacillus sp. DP1.3A]